MLSFWSVRGFTVLITVNLHNKSSKVTEWKVSFFFFFTLLFSWLAEYFFDWSSWRDGLSCLLNSWSAKKWLVAEYAGWPLCPVTGRLSARASWFSSFWPLIYTCRLFWLNSQVVLREQAQKEHAFMTQVHFKTLLALYLLMSPWPKQVNGQSRID